MKSITASHEFNCNFFSPKYKQDCTNLEQRVNIFEFHNFEEHVEIKTDFKLMQDIKVYTWLPSDENGYLFHKQILDQEFENLATVTLLTLDKIDLKKCLMTCIQVEISTYNEKIFKYTGTNAL